MAFRVGQKVVCINRGAWNVPVPDVRPEYGGVYQIVDIRTEQKYLRMRVGLVLAGFPSGHFWNAKIFRPVADRPTDISIFTEMLNPSRIKESVRELQDHDLETVHEVIRDLKATNRWKVGDQ